MVRWTILKGDLDTILLEMKERLLTESKIPYGPGSRLGGDWSCTGIRRGAFGCPTMTVEGITTTMTQTVIRSYWGLNGMHEWSFIYPQTFEGTQTLSAGHPLITETGERGPDANQVEKDPPVYYGWTTCIGCPLNG